MPVTAVPSTARTIPKSASRGPSGAEQYVRRLEVAVHDPAAVHVGQRVGQPRTEARTSSGSSGPPIQPLGQGRALHEVRHDERAAVLYPAVVQRDEPGVVQRRERPHLALLAAAVVRRGARMEELHRESPAGDPSDARRTTADAPVPSSAPSS